MNEGVEEVGREAARRTGDRYDKGPGEHEEQQEFPLLRESLDEQTLESMAAQLREAEGL
ncbi:MAG TPA: hypothetical protein VFR11_11700 [Micromonosporaceae bacterium]|nr:hypothetical protein [Micromonosporaceae bacterium]